MKIRFRLAPLVLFALFAVATPARAQEDDVLRAPALRDAPATLYDAIVRLRPGWLTPGADSSRVLVFLNGRHAGDVRVLQGIPTAEVVNARLRTAEFVRRTDPRFPREEFAAAIYVATRSAAAPRGGRVTVSLDAGFNLRSAAAAMDAGLADAGYDTRVLVTQNAVARFDDEGTDVPPSVGATLHYAVRGGWGVALTGVHTLKGWSGGYSREENQAVSADLTSTEGALLLTRELGIVRAGAGPAYRRVDWDWASGFCQCTNEQSSSGGAAGAAAEALVRLPLDSRVVPALRVLARYYPSQEAAYDGLAEPVGVEGFVVTMGLSVATRF